MTLSAEKFSQGMTTEQYIDIIKVNKDPFRQIHDGVAVPDNVLDYFNGLEQPVNLAVFTSDWCGDAMSTTPAILRLADASDNIRLSVFNRDDELELTNSFLPEHRAGTVPVFVVFDGEMGEIARFIETARSLVPAIDAMDEMVAQAAAAVSDEAEGRQQAPGTPDCSSRRQGGRMGFGDPERISAGGSRRHGPAGRRTTGRGRHRVAAAGVSEPMSDDAITIITMEDMAVVFSVTDDFGIHRESVSVELAREDPGEVSVDGGKVEITLPASQSPGRFRIHHTNRVGVARLLT